MTCQFICLTPARSLQVAVEYISRETVFGGRISECEC